MSDGRPEWFWVGFAAATLLAALVQAPPAAAQSANPLTLDAANDAAGNGNNRAGATSDEDFATPASAAASNTPSATPQLRGALVPLIAIEDADVLRPRSNADQRSTTNPPPAALTPEPPPPRALRSIAVDGDMAQEVQTLEPVLDGMAPSGDTPAQPDGIDTTKVDMRSGEDISAFEDPPAGFNPLLFQIEDIDPIQNRRTRRLFENEPYDPVGVKVGSFIWFPDSEIAGVGFSNVFSSPGGVADAAVALSSTHRLVSNWNVHALELQAASVRSYHNAHRSEEERSYSLEARGRLDVTGRTNLQLSAVRAVETESRSVLDASQVGDRTSSTTDVLAGTAQHRFNRLRFQLRGAVTDIEFDSVQDGAVFVSNEDRNYREKAGAIRASWEFKPTFSVFGEAAGDIRDFSQASADGFFRDSTGQQYRAGILFGTTSEILRGEVSLGYGLQHHDDPALGTLDGILIDANMSWRMTRLTSLLFAASSELTDSTTNGAKGVIERRFGLEARHAFRRHLLGTAGVQIDTRDVAGLSLSENELSFTLGAEYFARRELVLFGNYEHSRTRSDFPDSDYEADEIRVGVRMRR